MVYQLTGIYTEGVGADSFSKMFEEFLIPEPL